MCCVLDRLVVIWSVSGWFTRLFYWCVLACHVVSHWIILCCFICFLRAALFYTCCVVLLFLFYTCCVVLLYMCCVICVCCVVLYMLFCFICVCCVVLYVCVVMFYMCVLWCFICVCWDVLYVLCRGIWCCVVWCVWPGQAGSEQVWVWFWLVSMQGGPPGLCWQGRVRTLSPHPQEAEQLLHGPHGPIRGQRWLVHTREPFSHMLRRERAHKQQLKLPGQRSTSFTKSLRTPTPCCTQYGYMAKDNILSNI